MRIRVQDDLPTGIRIMSTLRLFTNVPLMAVLLVAAGCARDWTPREPGEARANERAAPAARAMAMLPASARRAGPGFASLPDRGNLVGYPAQRVVRRDGAYTWHRADLSETHALAAIVDGTLDVATPGGEALRFRYERHVEHPSGDWTWVGRLEGGARSDEVVVTFGEKAAFGTIAQPGRAPLKLTIEDGVTWLVETDRTKIAEIDNDATRPDGPDFLLPPKLASKPGMAGSPPIAAAAPATASATLTSDTTIDLVLGYTSGFAGSLGGQSQAVTRLHNLVDITNQAYANSQVGSRVRLVHTLQVNFPDGTANDDALEKLTGYKSGSGQIASDPAFNALRAARDQYGADLVSLVRKFNTPENDGCGIAWLIGGGRTGIDGSDEYFGYSVVSDGRDAGTDGKTYFCRDETLAHELGHNMGSQHDRATATDNGTLKYGAYAYSFGYKTDGSAGNFYTVMAYGDSGQTSYRVFSNPRITYCGGLACGVNDQADNARSLGQTMPLIAAFRATVVMPSNPVPGLFFGAIRGLGGKCLDAAGYGTANGTAIQVWGCTDGSQQRWSFVNESGSLRRDTTSRALDVIDYGTRNGSQLQLWDTHGGANQRWYFTNVAIMAPAGRVLDAIDASSANGTKIQLWDGSNTPQQTWNFRADGTITGKDGKCLDVEGFTTANGTSVQLWTCTGAANQKWQVGAAGTIRGYGGKCLETANGGSSNGTRIRIWDCNGGAHQSWRLRGEIRSAASNRCLDDPNAGQVNGSRVHLWDCHGGANQKWEFYSK